MAGVRKKLFDLNLSKSPGPDKLNPRLLKKKRTVLNKSLATLYQNTLKTGMIPSE